MICCTKSNIFYCFNDISFKGKQNSYHTHHQYDYDTDDNKSQKEQKQVPKYEIHFNDINKTQYNITFFTYIDCVYSCIFVNASFLHNHYLKEHDYNSYSFNTNQSI